MVAVDDGSGDHSAAVIRSFDDPRVRLILHEKNRGCGPARNTAMAAARGQWFVFLDSDDELLPGALETIHGRATAVGPSRLLRFRCSTISVPLRLCHHNELLDYELSACC